MKLECDFSWQAHNRDILGDSRSAYKIVSTVGRVRSPKRRVRDDDFLFGMSSDYPRIVFLLEEALQGVSAEILSFSGRCSTW